MDEVGLGFGGLDVGRGRPAVGELPRVEDIEVVLDLLLLRRAGEHDRVAASLELLDELTRTGHRLHFADQLVILRPLGRANFVALLALGAIVGQGLDHLIATHADVAVDAPDRQHDAVVAERAIPRDRVVVVGVDERAVDIEYRDAH